jgi:hypothetical protein
MSLYGQWLDVTIADEGTLSGECDLGQGNPCENFEFLNIYIPTIDSANVSLYVSDKLGGTYYPLGLSTNVFAAATGGMYTTFELGGYQFIKILSSASQSTAAVTFRVRGYRR